jgi:hypothetical protein
MDKKKSLIGQKWATYSDSDRIPNINFTGLLIQCSLLQILTLPYPLKKRNPSYHTHDSCTVNNISKECKFAMSHAACVHSLMGSEEETHHFHVRILYHGIPADCDKRSRKT